VERAFEPEEFESNPRESCSQTHRSELLATRAASEFFRSTSLEVMTEGILTTPRDRKANLFLIGGTVTEPQAVERKPLIDLSPRKNFGQFGSILGCVGLLTLLVIIGYHLMGEKPRLSILQPSPKAVAFTEDVPHDKVILYPVIATYAPARLHGDWMSSKIDGRGGVTSDLVGFTITSPGGTKLYKAASTTYGKFDVQIDTTGQYTIELNNAGLLRQSPRRVQVRATMEPR
jgi:hypothetical protein